MSTLSTLSTVSTPPAGSGIALLDAVVRDAIDPSYAQAAARHRAEDQIRGAGSRGGFTRAGMISIALLLGAGAVAGIAISSEQHVLPEVGAARNALAGTAGASTRQVGELERTLRARQREISALQRQRLETTAAGRALQQQSATLSAAAAQTPVSGAGVVVTVSDGAGGSGITTDRDLQDVVNALWAGGARAISVGGVRLGPQTAVRTAGGTILVGFQALSSPYSIDAIGGPGLLAGAGQSPAFAALSAATGGAHPDLVMRTSTLLHLPAAAPAHISAAQPLTAPGHS